MKLANLVDPPTASKKFIFPKEENYTKDSKFLNFMSKKLLDNKY